MISVKPDQREAVDALVCCAMDAEAFPFLVKSGRLEAPESLEADREITLPPADLSVGNAAFYALEFAGRKLVLIRTGIGLVNASTAAAAALNIFKPRCLISAGSAGGLGAEVAVGDVVVSQTLRYHDADATAFGYEPGQIPGMPVQYSGAERLLELVPRTIFSGTVRMGEMVSGDSFITANQVEKVRKIFPTALSTDMESVGLAQVAHSYQIPFISIRGISDLCGPRAGEEHSLSIHIVSAASADLIHSLLTAYDSINY